MKPAKNYSKKTSSFDINQVITDKIIAKLEAGYIPWQKPWKHNGEACNYKTMQPYRGINALLLNFSSFEKPYYMTFLQVQEMGGTIKKGAKSEMVVYWSFLYTDQEGKKIAQGQAGEQKDIQAKAYLKYYNVFNVADIEGIDFKFPLVVDKPQIEKLSHCEDIIASMPNRPHLQHGGGRACYFPLADLVKMPEMKHFKDSENYYSVLFHEHIHATGHKSRLSRKGIQEVNAFGSKSYSKEELVAELGAAFLCNHTGIVNHTIDNSAAYIQSWLKRLKNDKTLIVEAAGAAAKATDYILNKKNYPES